MLRRAVLGLVLAAATGCGKNPPPPPTNQADLDRLEEDAKNAAKAEGKARRNAAKD